MSQLARRSAGIFYGWWIVLASFVTLGVTFGLKTYVFAVFIKPMSDDMGWSRADISLAFTIVVIYGGLISPLVGKLVDSRGPRLSVLIGALLGGAALLGVSLLNALWEWLFLFGVVYATCETMVGSVPINTTITNWFNRKRGTAIGIVYASVSVGGLILVPATTIIVERYGWRAAWLFLAVTLVVSIAPINGLLLRRKPEDMGLLPDGDAKAPPATDRSVAMGERTEGDWTLGEAIRTRAFWLLALVMAMTTSGAIIFSVHGFAFASDLGFSADEVAAAISFSLVVGVPMRFLYGWLCDRVDIRYVVILFSLGLILANVLLALTTSLLMLYISMLVFGCSVGGTVPVPAALAARLFGRSAMGRIYGSLNLISSPFSALAAPAAGYVYDVTHSYHLAFYGAAVGLVLGVVAAQLARPPKRARQLTPSSVEAL